MLTIKDFPIHIENGIILSKNNQILFNFKDSSVENTEEFLKLFCVCANYGKRALLQKKTQSFPFPLKEAEDIAIIEMMNKKFYPCPQNEVEFEYTVISFDPKQILKPKERKVLYFKTNN